VVSTFGESFGESGAELGAGPLLDGRRDFGVALVVVSLVGPATSVSPALLLSSESTVKAPMAAAVPTTAAPAVSTHGRRLIGLRPVRTRAWISCRPSAGSILAASSASDLLVVHMLCSRTCRSDFVARAA
jgi:hypothetical protein